MLAEVLITFAILVALLALLAIAGWLKAIEGHLRAIALTHGQLAGEARAQNIRESQRPWPGGRR